MTKIVDDTVGIIPFKILTTALELVKGKVFITKIILAIQITNTWVSYQVL